MFTHLVSKCRKRLRLLGNLLMDDLFHMPIFRRKTRRSFPVDAYLLSLLTSDEKKYMRAGGSLDGLLQKRIKNGDNLLTSSDEVNFKFLELSAYVEAETLKKTCLALHHSSDITEQEREACRVAYANALHRVRRYRQLRDSSSQEREEGAHSEVRPTRSSSNYGSFFRSSTTNQKDISREKELSHTDDTYACWIDESFSTIEEGDRFNNNSDKCVGRHWKKPIFKNLNKLSSIASSTKIPKSTAPASLGDWHWNRSYIDITHLFEESSDSVKEFSQDSVFFRSKIDSPHLLDQDAIDGAWLSAFASVPEPLEDGANRELQMPEFEQSYDYVERLGKESINQNRNVMIERQRIGGSQQSFDINEEAFEMPAQLESAQNCDEYEITGDDMQPFDYIERYGRNATLHMMEAAKQIPPVNVVEKVESSEMLRTTDDDSFIGNSDEKADLQKSKENKQSLSELEQTVFCRRNLEGVFFNSQSARRLAGLPPKYLTFDEYWSSLTVTKVDACNICNRCELYRQTLASEKTAEELAAEFEQRKIMQESYVNHNNNQTLFNSNTDLAEEQEKSQKNPAPFCERQVIMPVFKRMSRRDAFEKTRRMERAREEYRAWMAQRQLEQAALEAAQSSSEQAADLARVPEDSA